MEGKRTGWSAHRRRSSVGAVFASGVQLLLVLVGRHLRLRRMASPISGQHRRSRGPGPAARPWTTDTTKRAKATLTQDDRRRLSRSGSQVDDWAEGREDWSPTVVMDEVCRGVDVDVDVDGMVWYSGRRQTPHLPAGSVWFLRQDYLAQAVVL